MILVDFSVLSMLFSFALGSCRVTLADVVMDEDGTMYAG